VIEDILKYARKSKERAVDEGDTSVTELKTQLAHQERLIQQLLAGSHSEETKSNRASKTTELTPLTLRQGTTSPPSPSP
jgi:hypothetical protein